MEKMRFKNIQVEDIDFITQTYKNKELTWDKRMLMLTNQFGISERQMRKWLVKLGIKEKLDPSIGLTPDSDQYKLALEKNHDSDKKYKLITWAQNNTAAHKGLIKNIEAYRDFLGVDKCEIIVIAGRYNNFNTLNGQKEKEYWDKSIEQYLCASKCDLNDNIQMRGDIKIVPTNLNPINSLESLSNNESLIVGHPTWHLRALPVIDPKRPKLILTTGACTLENYSQSLSGKKGEFNHSFGFVIVEIKDDSVFFVRQVSATKKTGEFTDLYYNVKDGNVKRTFEMEGIVLGDLHISEMCEKTVNSTLNVLMEKLKPKTVVCHDIFSAYSVNVHDTKNIFVSHRKEKEKTNDLQEEIDQMINWLKKLDDKGYEVVIVRSNHDDMVDRWLRGDWRSQPTLKNSEKYMEYALLTLQGKAENGIIPYVINEKYPKFKCLTRNESLKVGGFEVSQHADLGPNGSRGGGVNQFKKLSMKIIFGHTHSPARALGAINVGTNTKLRLDYTNGLTNWVNSQVIINKETKKAQNILFIDGEFTTFD